MQVLQCGAGLGARLLDQPGAQLPVVRQRVGGTSGSVQGKHELGGDAFVHVLLFRQREQLGQHLGVSAAAQRDVDAVEPGGDALSLETGAHRSQPRGFQAGERLTAP